MELNARIPGGHITDLVELVTGIDLVEVAARAAGPPAYAVAAAVPEPRPARLLTTHLHVQPGDLIQAPRLSGETRLGTAVLTADDPAALAIGIAAVRAGTEVVCSRDA